MRVRVPLLPVRRRASELRRLELPSFSHLARPAREREREVHRPLGLSSGNNEHADLGVLVHLLGRRTALCDRALRRNQIRTVDLLGIRHDEKVRAAISATRLNQNVGDSLVFTHDENRAPASVVSDSRVNFTRRNLAMNPPSARSQ